MLFHMMCCSPLPALLLLIVSSSFISPIRGKQLRAVGVAAGSGDASTSVDDGKHPGKKNRRHHHAPQDLHTHRQRSSREEESYRQELHNNFDVQYAADISVGGQSLTTVLDSGSFELLVFSERCTTCGTYFGLYNDEKSETFSSSDFIGEHNFGSGTTKSNEAYETVEIGPFVSEKQHFWEVVGADMAILEDDYFHAILGMGPPGSAQKFAEINAHDAHDEVAEYLLTHDSLPESVQKEVQHYDDTVQHLKTAVSLTENLGMENVSICLGKSPGAPGSFIWNDHSTRDEAKKFTRLDVVGDIYWSTNLTNVELVGKPGSFDSVMGRAVGCSNTGACTAVVDTGTSLIVAPAEAIAAVQEMLDNWIDPTGDCSDLSGLPELQFELNGQKFTLPPEAYIGKMSGDFDENIQRMMPQLRRSNVNQSTDGSCVPLLMAGEADSQMGQLWILGMPFFRKYYTTFHFANHGGEATAMSFAIADDSCRPSQTDVEVLRAQVSRPKRQPFHIDASKVRVPRLFQKNAGRNVMKEQSFLETKVHERLRVHI